MTQQRTGNAQNVVYNSLRNSILSLNLVPGTVVSENEISLRFKVSRTPVREAFIALSKESLVTVIPQKGSMVSLIDFARVEQEFFLRESLEAAALKRFLGNVESSHIFELERCVKLQSEACEEKKYELFFRYENEFHRTFFSDQKVAWDAVENSCGHYQRVRLLTIWLLDIVKDLVAEHEAILRAIKERDAERAMALLETHLHKLNTEEDMLKRLFPDYFIDSREISQTVDFGGLGIT
jgi:DNA-binding GntR family transcriptional regulator